MEQISSCAGNRCCWAYSLSSETIDCIRGDGYSVAKFLEAEESSFHDADLMEATKTIKAALEKVAGNANGRVLGLLDTGDGILLAWVNHDKDRELTGSYVTPDNSAEEIARALKIKKDSPAQAS